MIYKGFLSLLYPFKKRFDKDKMERYWSLKDSLWRYFVPSKGNKGAPQTTLHIILSQHSDLPELFILQLRIISFVLDSWFFQPLQ